MTTEPSSSTSAEPAPPQEYATLEAMIADLSRKQGLTSNKRLARVLSTAMGMSVGERTASNYRRAESLPEKGMEAMASVLGVTGDHQLEQLWNRLLAEARLVKTLSEPTPPDTPAPDEPVPGRSWWRDWKLASGVALALAAMVGVVVWQWKSPLLPVSQEERTARVLSALEVSELAVLGDRSAPLKAYVVLQIYNCTDHCIRFFVDQLPPLYREFIDTKRLALVFVPWWHDDWHTSPDFEVHYGATCMPTEKRVPLLAALYAQGLPVIASRATAYGAVRVTAGDPPGLVACLGDDARRQRIASETLNVHRSIGDFAARIFIDGKSFSVKEIDAYAEAIRKSSSR